MATAQTAASTRPGADLRIWRFRTAATALFLLAITILLARIRVGFFPLYQFQSQDSVPLAILSAALMVTAFLTPKWELPHVMPKRRRLLATGIVIVAVLAFGTYTLMQNFPLSIDERMVVFDMAVFDGGHLAAPLDPSWRPYAKALVPAFLLNENMPTGLVSSYLPMNALLRLAFSKVADPALFNPLLALAGGVALLDIARRIFQEDVPACCVVLLVYALSAQMLVNAMTVYSMTGHMALNLIWLAAFLRSGRLGNSIAIATGFIATGFHQLAFHPFFVAPFLLWRLRRGEWKLVLIYAGAYSAIILWWLYYSALLGHEVANTLHQAPNAHFLSRLATTFAERRGDTFITTVLNMLRFVAWQNLALLPLLSAAAVVSVRDRGLPGALMLGIVLWLTFITAVIPFQGHGWGYRYFHPYLGSFALLAGYGYRELRQTIGRKADAIVLTMSSLTAVVTIPLLLIATQRIIAPYVALERYVAQQQGPMVLIDTDARPTKDGQWAGNAIENVRNLPDLRNRPLRLSSRAMTPDLLAGLCDRGKITVLTRSDQQRVGFAMNASPESTAFDELVDVVRAKSAECFVPAVGGQ